MLVRGGHQQRPCLAVHIVVMLGRGREELRSIFLFEHKYFLMIEEGPITA